MKLTVNNDKGEAYLEPDTNEMGTLNEFMQGANIGSPRSQIEGKFKVDPFGNPTNNPYFVIRRKNGATVKDEPTEGETV